MQQIAKKLKNSPITMVDPLAGEFLQDLIQKTIGVYHFYPSKMFIDKGLEMYENFVQTFLSTHAYVGDEDSRLPSYDPYHVGLTEAFPDEEYGPTKQWFGWYSNCYIVYTEYPEHPEQNNMILGVDEETNNGALSLRQIPKDIGQEHDDSVSE